MKVKKAQELYHGKEGYNCTQAILKTFQYEFGVDEHTILRASELGRGNAENGLCGALYAAHLLFRDNEIIQRINAFFENAGGSTRCIEIRKARKLSCKECVGLAADSIQRTTL